MVFGSWVLHKCWGSSNLSLPLPIAVRFSGGLYLFSGNRRVNLAGANDQLVKVWVVDAPIKRSVINEIKQNLKNRKEGKFYNNNLIYVLC